MSFCTRAYPCLSKLSVSLKLRGFVTSWVSCCWTDIGLSSGTHWVGVDWSNSRRGGGGLLYTLMCFRTAMQFVYAVCMQVPTINGVNWGNDFAIGDANTKNCPLKCLIFQTNEESFTFVKTDVSIKRKLTIFKNFFLR